jgi:eukaryotic-like serine/threonine-protein kinase
MAAGRDVHAVCALALARAGETAGAENLAAQLKKEHPLDTLVQNYWLPIIRAAIELDRSHAQKAIEFLQVAAPYEMGQATSSMTVALCPPHARAGAYLMLGNGAAAASEFQKILDHRGIVAPFVTGALARLGLARAYALQHDMAQARAAYQDFLTLWKEADPDSPILKQAKSEYAKLK